MKNMLKFNECHHVTFTVVCFCRFFLSNPDWWFARKTTSGGDKDEGYVPSNYVATEDTLETYE